MKPREITDIVIHCADTPDDAKHVYTIEEIDDWHRERGFKRDEAARKAFNPGLTSVGYHYVIYRDGSVHAGRNEDEVGAHVQGHNAHSIGICLVGTRHFTPEQWTALNALLVQKRLDYPKAEIKGHYEYDTAKGKTCPNFSVPSYVLAGCQPAESWVFNV